MAVLHPNTPLIHRQAIGEALVAGTGHGEPGIGEAPAEGRILLAVIHVAIDALTVDFLDVLAEEFGDVFIGRPVDRHTQLVAIDLLELLLQLRALEPVGAKPVEVGELLHRQLIDLAVRPGGEGNTDEVIKIQRRQGVILGLVLDHVADGDRLAVAEVGADQVGVVDVTVVDVLAGLHLRLQLLDHVAFLHQVVPQANAGDLAEGASQRLGFVFVGGDGFRRHVDFHAAEWLGRLDEPLELLHLLFGRQRRGAELRFQPFLRGVFIGIGPGRTRQSGQRQQGRQCHAMSGFVVVFEHELPPSNYREGWPTVIPSASLHTTTQAIARTLSRCSSRSALSP